MFALIVARLFFSACASVPGMADRYEAKPVDQPLPISGKCSRDSVVDDDSAEAACAGAFAFGHGLVVRGQPFCVQILRVGICLAYAGKCLEAALRRSTKAGSPHADEHVVKTNLRLIRHGGLVTAVAGDVAALHLAKLAQHLGELLARGCRCVGGCLCLADNAAARCRCGRRRGDAPLIWVNRRCWCRHRHRHAHVRIEFRRRLYSSSRWR